MATFADVLPDSYIPASVQLGPETAGLLLVVSSTDGFGVRFSDYTGEPASTRMWLRDWAIKRRADLHQHESAELFADVSFLILVAEIDRASGALRLGEFTYGEFPAAPEQWPSVTMGALLDHGIRAVA